MKRIFSLFTALIMILSLAACGGKGDDSEATDPGADIVTDTPAVVTEAVRETKKTVSFLAAGDNIIHECVYLDAMTVAASVGSASDYYFDNMYSDVEEAISGADISFINAEGPLDTDYTVSGYPSFNAPSEAGDALVNMGFDVINLANNHMLDLHKWTGLQGTIDYWKTKDVVTIGGYESEDDYNDIRIVEKDGIKIAFLSYTYGINGFKQSELNSDTSNLYIPLIDDSEITRQIGEAREQADMVFVSMHWGEENVMTPTSEQKRLAQLIADAGAEVIIGHHSHTIQPVEWLTGENGNKTLVFYSLGNFLHTQLKSYNLVGGVATFNIVKEGDSAPYIDDVLFIPTVCHYTANTSVKDSLDYYKRENLKIYWLSDYTEELAQSHGSQYWNSFTLDTLKGYVNDTIDNEFLPDSLKK